MVCCCWNRARCGKPEARYYPAQRAADGARARRLALLAMRAREGLLQGGDLQVACYTCYCSMAAQLECATTLDEYEAEFESAYTLSERTSNNFASQFFLSHRQLLRALRGETDAPGSVTDRTLDETMHLVDIQTNPLATATFHV